MGYHAMPLEIPPPLCFLNPAVSLAAIRNAVFCVLEMVEIKLKNAVPRLERRQYSVWGNSIGAEHERGSTSLWDDFDEIRSSLTVVTLDSKVAERICCEEDAICAVCLCEYKKEDPVWLLPLCSHIFHKRCLDQWLHQNQTTCPTCRSSLGKQEITHKRKQR